MQLECLGFALWWHLQASLCEVELEGPRVGLRRALWDKSGSRTTWSSLPVLIMANHMSQKALEQGAKAVAQTTPHPPASGTPR